MNEIKQLATLQQKYNLKVIPRGDIKDNLIPVDFISGNKSWYLYLSDEYKDFHPENQLMCIFLVLRTLEDYEESSDFLVWCNQYGLNASHIHWLSYFKELGNRYTEIKNTLGTIDSIISSLEYQLRSGAFYELTQL
ncbi:MAG: hypothetical protein KDC93_16010 [Cyclobacteriaceae bacterium]|nr:hypothetical protein [Cyclobacteriaceae bacterium]